LINMEKAIEILKRGLYIILYLAVFAALPIIGIGTVMHYAGLLPATVNVEVAKTNPIVLAYLAVDAIFLIGTIVLIAKELGIEIKPPSR